MTRALVPLLALAGCHPAARSDLCTLTGIAPATRAETRDALAGSRLDIEVMTRDELRRRIGIVPLAMTRELVVLRHRVFGGGGVEVDLRAVRGHRLAFSPHTPRDGLYEVFLPPRRELERLAHVDGSTANLILGLLTAGVWFLTPGPAAVRDVAQTIDRERDRKNEQIAEHDRALERAWRTTLDDHAELREPRDRLAALLASTGPERYQLFEWAPHDAGPGMPAEHPFERRGLAVGVTWHAPGERCRHDETVLLAIAPDDDIAASLRATFAAGPQPIVDRGERANLDPRERQRRATACAAYRPRDQATALAFAAGLRKPLALRLGVHAIAGHALGIPSTIVGLRFELDAAAGEAVRIRHQLVGAGETQRDFAADAPAPASFPPWFADAAVLDCRSLGWFGCADPFARHRPPVRDTSELPPGWLGRDCYSLEPGEHCETYLVERRRGTARLIITVEHLIVDAAGDTCRPPELWYAIELSPRDDITAQLNRLTPNGPVAIETVAAAK